MPWMDVKSLCVEPIEHHASDRDRTQAQHVGHPHDVLAQPCQVATKFPGQAVLLVVRSPFPAAGSIPVGPVEHSKGQPLDLLQAPLHAPSPFCPPLVQQVEEPVAHDGVGVDFPAFCRAAAGLVFNEQRLEWLGPPGRHTECWCGRSPRV